MNFVIRQEAKSDYSIIYDLIKTAFRTAKVSDGTEQDFADALRGGGNYIPELALVAEVKNQIVGHIMFTKTYVTMSGGSRYNTLLVAPLVVDLAYRGQGIGSALIREGLRLSQEMGYESAFLCGDPEYYQRFDFKPTHLYGIQHESIPAQYVMARELLHGCLSGVTGMINM